MVAEKKCPQCKEIKEREQFFYNGRAKDKMSIWCKICDMEASAQWAKDNREQSNGIKKKWQRENPDVVRNARYIREYGITLVQYNIMLKDQNFVCKICKKPETRKKRKSNEVKELAVDHNHVTGKVRGLLCDNCNQAIGLMRDKPHVAFNASLYLRDLS